MKTIFQLVCEMNEAFGNPEGDPENLDWERLSKLLPNIRAETNELKAAIEANDIDGIRDALCDIRVFALGGLHALGYMEFILSPFCNHTQDTLPHTNASPFSSTSVRPAEATLVDLQVSTLKDIECRIKDPALLGSLVTPLLCLDRCVAYTQWECGFLHDSDMRAVIAGVMTRFCQNQQQLEATCRRYGDEGIEFTVHGEFPNVYLKSAHDQGDEYPKGKFLKSVGYSQPVFAPIGGGNGTAV